MFLWKANFFFFLWSKRHCKGANNRIEKEYFPYFQEVKPNVEEKLEEEPDSKFNPFQIKNNMRLAPLVR